MSAAIDLFGPIGGEGGVTALNFLTRFRALPGKDVTLNINSQGGSVTEALTMFNGMKATRKTIEVRVLGLAASAASYLAMVGDKVVMPANSLMLLHHPAWGATDGRGTAADHRNAADVLEVMGEILLRAYSARFKGTAKQLNDLMTSERLLTAADCLRLGLCDEVTAEIDAAAITAAVARLPARLQAARPKAPPISPSTIWDAIHARENANVRS